jgi:hypothetical protein
VENNKKSQPENEERSSEEREGLSAEDWVLFTAIFSFVVFLWIIVLLFIPLLSGQPAPIPLPPVIVDIAATRGFVLPPTWTPGPTPVVVSTPTPTQIYDGSLPTRVYTPRPTSLPGIPFLFPNIVPINNIEVIDLARIMQGESPGDKEAAYYVGWVAKNRRTHSGYGPTYAVVSNGFFGYRADIQPRKEFLEIAWRIIRARKDPTEGSLYALSRTDITQLGIPLQRADVAKGEWFFFRTWPLAGR